MRLGTAVVLVIGSVAAACASAGRGGDGCECTPGFERPCTGESGEGTQVCAADCKWGVCGGGSTCACDTSSACEAGCACDPACSAGCACDTGAGCQSGCDCDADCRVCAAAGNRCQKDSECCGDGARCATDKRCCVQPGTRIDGSYCQRDSDCCSGSCGDEDECCTPQAMPCLTFTECCRGLTCGTSLKCCAAIGFYCRTDPGACCPGTMCSRKVRNLGGGSSTTEPDRCCVPGGGPCASSEDCCEEDPAITGVQCYGGRCRRSMQSPCTKDEQCTYRCEDGKCG